jgi:hypothetical protein
MAVKNLAAPTKEDLEARGLLIEDLSFTDPVYELEGERFFVDETGDVYQFSAQDVIPDVDYDATE